MPNPTRAAADQTRPLRFTLLQRIQVAIVSWTGSAVVGLIGRTLRVTITYEEGSIRSLDELHPGIYPFWHRCVLPATWLFRNRHIGVLTSLSRDGEYIARLIRRFGFLPVRGSSSRGGERALRAMNKLLARGHAVAFTIDGPRGPRYVAKRGPVLLARMSEVAVIPFYVAVERAWVLKTWDAMMIPKPFSRIYARIGRKIFVPPDADDSAMDRYYAEMQASLERVTAFAEAQFSGQP